MYAVIVQDFFIILQGCDGECHGGEDRPPNPKPESQKSFPHSCRAATESANARRALAAAGCQEEEEEEEEVEDGTCDTAADVFGFGAARARPGENFDERPVGAGRSESGSHSVSRGTPKGRSESGSHSVSGGTPKLDSASEGDAVGRNISVQNMAGGYDAGVEVERGGGGGVEGRMDAGAAVGGVGVDDFPSLEHYRLLLPPSFHVGIIASLLWTLFHSHQTLRSRRFLSLDSN